MALETGEQVGQYRVERLLGRGGMATVYKALHDKLDRYVALKLMHQTLLEDDQFKQRFEREARIIANLDHSNIVPIYDFSEYQDQPFLVMKYIEGRTLKKLLKEGPLTLDEIRRIMTPIASALDYAHSQNVLHRDIKPSNIILDTRGVPYLADFGLARMVKAGESTMSVDMLLGTPYYISPEQAKGGVELTPRTDVYSFGIVLYELLVGRVPFAADTAYATVHEQIYTPPPQPSSINPEITPQVDAVLLRALAKNPNERYASATAVMQALEMALQDSGLVSFREERKTLNTEMLAPTPTDQARPREPEQNTSPQHKSKPKRDEPRRAIPVPPVPPEPPKEPGFIAKLEEFGEKVEAWADETFDSEARRRRKESRMSIEERARKRVEKRMEERTGLIIHGGIYLFINLMFWSLFLSGGGGFPWPMFISVPWGFGMWAHFSEYYNKYGAGAERREALIQQEIERERSRLEGRKQKNDAYYYDDVDTEEKIGRLRLNEDGELTDSFAEEWRDVDNYDERYQ